MCIEVPVDGAVGDAARGGPVQSLGITGDVARRWVDRRPGDGTRRGGREPRSRALSHAGRATHDFTALGTVLWKCSGPITSVSPASSKSPAEPVARVALDRVDHRDEPTGQRRLRGPARPAGCHGDVPAVAGRDAGGVADMDTACAHVAASDAGHYSEGVRVSRGPVRRIRPSAPSVA